MKFSTTKNKLSTTLDQTQQNQNNVDNLNKLSLKQKDSSFLPQSREIILAENIQGSYLDDLWTGSYQFDNLNPKYLRFIQPYSILTISDTLEDYIYLTGDRYWWEEYNIKDNNDKNTLVLHMWIDKGGFGYSQYYQSSLTVKLRIYNPSLFEKLIWKKI